MKVFALVQARTDSSRLPGKVLKNILNKPMIIHQLERINCSKYINKLILVTSNQESDDLLAKTVKNYNFDLFRGDKDNVLKRFYQTLEQFDCEDEDIIVRLTGDCPLHDSAIIDETIASFISSNCDYITNAVEPIYPDGFDVEVFNFKSLKIAYNNAKKESDLEHVTPYIRNSNKLVVKNIVKDKVHSDWRLTVDEEKDLELVKIIFNHFNSTFFSFEDIVKYLNKNLDFLLINNEIIRNEGYLKSLKEDND